MPLYLLARPAYDDALPHTLITAVTEQFYFYPRKQSFNNLELTIILSPIKLSVRVFSQFKLHNLLSRIEEEVTLALALC